MKFFWNKVPETLIRWFEEKFEIEVFERLSFLNSEPYFKPKTYEQAKRIFAQSNPFLFGSGPAFF